MNYHHKAFTLVELLIVIVVIAILASISVVAYNGIQARAIDSEKASEVSTIHKKLQMYKIDNGHYPCVNDILNTNASTVLDLPLDATQPSDKEPFITGLYSGNADAGTTNYRYITYENGVVKNTGECPTYTLGYWSKVKSAAVEYNGN